MRDNEIIFFRLAWLFGRALPVFLFSDVWAMIFEEVDRLKSQYTDQYVMVEEGRPELARFADIVGQIKTINYNGRALVEFLDYHANIGWYDIALDYLKIVPKPDPNAKKEKPAAKSAPAAKSEAAKPAAAKPAGKSSTADILAAARAKGGGAAPAAKPAAGKPSTAEILAAARAKAAGATAPAAQPAAETPADEPAVEAPAAKAKTGKPTGPLPTTTAERIAFCRRVDAK